MGICSVLNLLRIISTQVCVCWGRRRESKMCSCTSVPNNGSTGSKMAIGIYGIYLEQLFAIYKLADLAIQTHIHILTLVCMYVNM